MKVYLRKGVRFIRDGSRHEIAKVLQGGNLEILNLSTNHPTTISRDELAKAIFKGEVRVEIPNAHTNGSKNVERFQDFSLIDDKYREITGLRYEAIKPLIRKHSKEFVKERLQEILPDEKFDKISRGKRGRLHYITLYRWKKRFEESGCDIRSLVPSYRNCGSNNTRIGPEVESITQASIENEYLTTLRGNGQDVYLDIVGKIASENMFRAADDQLKIPSQKALYRRINGIDPYEAAKRRYSLRKAEELYGVRKKGIKARWPLDRVEMDHTKLDLFVVDEEDRLPLGRPWVTWALDRYSDYTLGFYVGFEGPSYLSVMECLYHAIQPKDYVSEWYPKVDNTWSAYGVPSTIIVDCGMDFRGPALEDPCLQLGIVIQYTPPRMAWFKGAIERKFRTLNTQLLGQMPGKSFSNYIERDEYDPVRNAVISFDTFLEILHTWLIDMQSQKFNRGVAGTPQKKWEEGIKAYPPALPPNKEELYALLGRIEYRLVREGGVQLSNIFYNSPQLNELWRFLISKGKAKERVPLKYHPGDLSRIYVWSQKENRYLEVESTDQEYTKDLSWWKHNVIVNNLNKEKANVDMVALANKKAEIQEIVEEEFQKTRKVQKSRQKIAKWNQVNSKKLTRGIPGDNQHAGVSDFSQEGPEEGSDSSDAEITVLKNGGIKVNRKEKKPKKKTNKAKSPKKKKGKKKRRADTGSTDGLDLTGWGYGELS